MNSHATNRFWALFAVLPPDVKQLAVKTYRIWREDPSHPSLHFRKLRGSTDRFTIRIGDHYRALGRLESYTLIWVWIGSHAEYDRLVN